MRPLPTSHLHLVPSVRLCRLSWLRAPPPTSPEAGSRCAIRRRNPCSRCRLCSSRGRGWRSCSHCSRRTCRRRWRRSSRTPFVVEAEHLHLGDVAGWPLMEHGMGIGHAHCAHAESTLPLSNEPPRRSFHPCGFPLATASANGIPKTNFPFLAIVDSNSQQFKHAVPAHKLAAREVETAA